MAQLNVRLDDDTRGLFDALAQARGLSASDLVRSLIDRALGRDDVDRPQADVTPIAISALDRRKLTMQHEILARLIESKEGAESYEAKYHWRMVEVMSNGFTAEYYSDFQMINPEMGRRDCELTNDILDMFTEVGWSLNHLADEERADLGARAESALTFHGFDFNDSYESRLASYARYMIGGGSRWQSLAARFGPEHDGGNSHGPFLASYQRMLAVWIPMRKRNLRSWAGPESLRLSVADLAEIAAARAFPTRSR